jgi:hypothetical protein
VETFNPLGSPLVASVQQSPAPPAPRTDELGQLEDLTLKLVQTPTKDGAETREEGK